MTRRPSAPWLGLDETKIDGKQRLVITDIGGRRPIEMLADRDRRTLAGWLHRFKDRSMVKGVAIDMWRPYLNVCHQLLTAMTNWRTEILAVLDTPITNAYTEALNGVAKTIIWPICIWRRVDSGHLQRWAPIAPIAGEGDAQTVLRQNLQAQRGCRHPVHVARKKAPRAALAGRGIESRCALLEFDVVGAIIHDRSGAKSA